jgi:glycosyltransferase involved in cell wall biosynthesis
VGIRVRYYSKGTRADPSSRYRIHQYVPGLAALGVEVEVSPLFGDGYTAIAGEACALRRAARRLAAAGGAYARRAASLRAADRYDLIVVERQLFPYLPAAAELPLFRGRRPVAIEFDDAIYLTPLHGAKLASLCRSARVVLAGNAELARFAREAGARQDAVAVVPTVVDLRRYPPRERYADGARFVVGWVGLPYNLGSLERLAGPLARLAREVPLEVRVISSRAPRLPGVPVTMVPWREADEAARLADLDVGVMPLPDDRWSRGKCGLKLLQYMAAGTPAVASPVGVNGEIVVHGRNGYLADGEDSWLAALRALAASASLRARVGAAGRRTVEERFSLDAWTPRLAGIYARAAA